jgi:hypothetical protein
MDLEDKLIKEHLADYKINVLNIIENGLWRNKKYGHILPEILKERNILASNYYQSIIDEIKNKDIKLHQYFHHLNSSQALCFNLFHPLLVENYLFPIFNKVNKKIEQNEIVEKYEFEYIADHRENTNFDLFLKTKNNINFYFEIKYTENEFGKEIKDEKHIQKYNTIYKNKLKVFNNVNIDIFLQYYQIFRNLIYNDNGYSIFVFPRDRIDLENSLNEVLNKYCNKKQQEHAIIIYIENIVESILDYDNQKIKDHYKLFMEKYCPNKVRAYCT